MLIVLINVLWPINCRLIVIVNIINVYFIVFFCFLNTYANELSVVDNWPIEKKTMGCSQLRRDGWFYFHYTKFMVMLTNY